MFRYTPVEEYYLQITKDGHSFKRHQVHGGNHKLSKFTVSEKAIKEDKLTAKFTRLVENFDQENFVARKQCFYCGQPVGEKHLNMCYFIHVKGTYRIVVEVEGDVVALGGQKRKSAHEFLEDIVNSDKEYCLRDMKTVDVKGKQYLNEDVSWPVPDEKYPKCSKEYWVDTKNSILRDIES